MTIVWMDYNLNQQYKGTVVGVTGLHLEAVDESGGRHLIADQQALDRDKFRQIWRALSPPLILEDGSPYEPF